MPLAMIAQRATRVLCAIQLGFARDGCCLLFGTHIAWRIEQCGKRRVRPAPGWTASARKPGANP